MVYGSRGISGWGSVILEYVDAKGNRGFSVSEKAEGLRWQNEILVNYDGWKFVGMEIGKQIGVLIDYPIKITGMVVGMRRQVVYLSEMKPVRNPTIRLKNMGVIEYERLQQTQ